jgi:hypothetical protein
VQDMLYNCTETLFIQVVVLVILLYRTLIGNSVDAGDGATCYSEIY